VVIEPAPVVEAQKQEGAWDIALATISRGMFPPNQVKDGSRVFIGVEAAGAGGIVSTLISGQVAGGVDLPLLPRSRNRMPIRSRPKSRSCNTRSRKFETASIDRRHEKESPKWRRTIEAAAADRGAGVVLVGARGKAQDVWAALSRLGQAVIAFARLAAIKQNT